MSATALRLRQAVVVKTRRGLKHWARRALSNSRNDKLKIQKNTNTKNTDKKIQIQKIQIKKYKYKKTNL